MLRPCPACERHVRSSETHCPFCEVELPAATVSLSASHLRLGRAAAFVAGAAVVASVAAGCGDDRPKPKDPNTQKPYGAPPADGLLV